MTTRGDEYYDDEASIYSAKRYPRVVTNYIQFLFTHRRDILLATIKQVIRSTPTPRTLFEMGCADGVLLRAVEQRYPQAFTQMLGVDVSEPMVREAIALTQDPTITYKVRSVVAETGSYTCALEIGVAALVLDTKGELKILADQLVPGGYLICSIAGRNSIAAVRGGTAAQRALLKSYSHYEADMRTLFTIEETRSCGIDIPFLWRFPAVGRLLQPLFETLGSLSPGLAHERIYLLKKKA